MENKTLAIGVAVAVIVVIAVLGLSLSGNESSGVPTTTFLEKQGTTICTENGKPIVRMFGTTWCPHCKWIKSTYESVVLDYVSQGKIISYNWEMDINDNSLTPDKETAVPPSELAVFEAFNPQGSVPTFVFGCKYYRIGNGYERQNDLKAEEKEFREVIEKVIEETQE